MVTREEITGEIRGFPKIIVLAMLREQYLQGNRIDVEVFTRLRYSDCEDGGFDWDNSRLSNESWERIIGDYNYQEFFNKLEMYV